MNSIGCGFNVYVYIENLQMHRMCLSVCNNSLLFHTAQMLYALCKRQQQNEIEMRSLDFGCCNVRKGVDQKTSVLLANFKGTKHYTFVICVLRYIGWLVVWLVTMHLFCSPFFKYWIHTLNRAFFIQKFQSLDWFFFLIWLFAVWYFWLIESEIQDECGFCRFGYEIYALANREKDTFNRIIRK